MPTGCPTAASDEPDVEAPTATNRGDQVGMTPGCSNLYGMRAFRSATPRSTHCIRAPKSYVRAVTEAVKKNRQQGFVLKDDAKRSSAAPKPRQVGTGRPFQSTETGVALGRSSDASDAEAAHTRPSAAVSTAEAFASSLLTRSRRRDRAKCDR